MNRLFLGAAALLAVGLNSSFASAGVYTDDLSKCLVKSTTAGDQEIMVQWIFAVMAQHPTVKPLSAVSEQQRDALNQKAAGLYGRLLFSDCRKEVVDALKYEGTGVLEASFAVLGQVAMRSLMGDPAVTSGMQAFGKYFDTEEMKNVLKDAGIQAPPKP